METKKFTQFGLLPVIIFGILLTLFSFKSYYLGFDDTSGRIYVGLSALMLVCALAFYRIVIEVDENQISFKLGIGLFKRTYQINDLTSCSSVRCSFISGFGIRKIANGWLYNVSGLDTIELRFNDTKDIIQIGTNKSDEISIIVNDLIEKNINTNESSSIVSTFSIDWSKWILAIIVLFFALLLPYQGKNDKISVNKYNFKISGAYSKSVNYKEISEIDTISIIPEIEYKTNGYYLMDVAKGHFKLGGIGNAYLNLRLKYPPFIKIRLKNNDYIFFNLNVPNDTKELFKNIENKTLENKNK